MMAKGRGNGRAEEKGEGRERGEGWGGVGREKGLSVL